MLNYLSTIHLTKWRTAIVTLAASGLLFAGYIKSTKSDVALSTLATNLVYLAGIVGARATAEKVKEGLEAVLKKDKPNV